MAPNHRLHRTVMAKMRGTCGSVPTVNARVSDGLRTYEALAAFRRRGDERALAVSASRGFRSPSC